MNFYENFIFIFINFYNYGTSGRIMNWNESKCQYQTGIAR
jgi:hypothetical protein